MVKHPFILVGLCIASVCIGLILWFLSPFIRDGFHSRRQMQQLQSRNDYPQLAATCLRIVHSVTNEEEMAGTLHADFSAAIGAVNAAKADRREKKLARNAAFAALRQRITALRNELKPLLTPDDSRWFDFGFDVPADVHVTSAPEGVKLAIDPVTHHVVASWTRPVNTDRFRVYERVSGTDTEYKPVDTTTDTSFDLGTFASGAHVDVQVTAINSAGESVPSQMVEIVVP